MQQLTDDTWQITKINNLKTLINERDQALQNKLAELNAPVQKQIGDAVAVSPQKIFITSAPYSGVIRLLEADIQLTNNAMRSCSILPVFWSFTTLIMNYFTVVILPAAKTLPPNRPQFINSTGS